MRAASWVGWLGWAVDRVGAVGLLACCVGVAHAQGPGLPAGPVGRGIYWPDGTSLPYARVRLACVYFQPVEKQIITSSSFPPATHLERYVASGAALTGDVARAAAPMYGREVPPGTFITKTDSCDFYLELHAKGSPGVAGAGAIASDAVVFVYGEEDEVKVAVGGDDCYDNYWPNADLASPISVQNFNGVRRPPVGAGTNWPPHRIVTRVEVDGGQVHLYASPDVYAATSTSGGVQYMHQYVVAGSGEFLWMTYQIEEDLGDGEGGGGCCEELVELVEGTNARLDDIIELFQEMMEPDPSDPLETNLELTPPGETIVADTFGEAFAEHGFEVPAMPSEIIPTVPVWEITIPSVSLPGGAPTAPIDITIDFAAAADFRWMWVTLMVTGVTIWGIGRVWQELRR